MAENLDMPQMGNFSIQDTMDMGMGSQELLDGLFAPETATGSPDDIQDIKNEPAAAPAPAKKTTSKQSAAPESASEVAPTDEKKDENPVKDIQSFLYGDDNEEEEEAEDNEPAAAPAKKAATQSADNQEDSDENEDGEEAPVSQFTALSKDLFKLGVFSKDEDEEDVAIETPEADLTQENNQVSVIRQALSDQGFDKEDIDTEVERLKNYGDLENVATKHHKVLIKKEAAKLQQLEQEKQAQLQQQQAIRQQYYQNVNQVLQEKLKAKEFDGIPINPKLAGELQDFLVTDKYKTASGETLTDFDRAILELKRPENHATKVKLALLMKIMEKDPTLSTIQKTGITKKSNELFGEVARQAQKSSVKSKTSSKPTSWFQ
ncbi:MAG: hypothetical protein EBR30_18910 [Cytophagia bacterium]|nr:hypothetical protein [Cytophagia bacterium]